MRTAHMRARVHRRGRAHSESRSVELRRLDRLLLAELQYRFPVRARPYAELGTRLGLSEGRVLRLVAGYMERGIVRRIGPRWDARACGIDTVLVAVSVPPSDVRSASSRINALGGVTHNYLRRHPLNIWFTLASRDARERKARLRELRRLVKPERLLLLPATRVLKLGVLFDTGLRDERGEGAPRARIAARRPARREAFAAAVSRVPTDLALAPAPFPPGAIGAVGNLLASGQMRRFGAVLDGRALGYRYGALVAWRVPRGREKEAGRALASFAAVSHCYARKPAPSWPYALYTMIHARDRRSAMRLLREMSRAARDSGRAVLETARTLGRSALNLADVVGTARRRTGSRR